MKRYISIDFIRGLAILLMLALHVLIETYNVEIFVQAVQGEGPALFAVFAILIVYFASFAGLFMCVSSLSNVLSMAKQYEKMKDNPNAIKIIRRTQVIRGSVMFFLGYFITAFLWPNILEPLLSLVVGTTFEVLIGSVMNVDYWTQGIYLSYWVDVISAIGLATIIVALVYTKLLEQKKTPQQISKTMGWIAVIIFLETPFILMSIRALPGFWHRPGSGWETRNAGISILYFLLVIVGGSNQSIFPWYAMSFIGAAIAMDLLQGPVNKSFVKKWIGIGILMLFLGLILQVVFILIAGELPEPLSTAFTQGFGDLFGLDNSSSAPRMFVDGGEIICLALLLGIIEGRRHAKGFAKLTTPIRRAGLVSLSIYALQPLAYLVMFFFGWIFNYGLHDQYQMHWYHSLLVIAVTLLLYLGLIRLWELIGFKGSLEWIVGKLLSRGRADALDRINIKESLYNVQPLGEPEPKK